MSVISWGKPLVEIADSVDGAAGTTFTALPAIKKDTALLTPTEGEETTALGEGSELIDSRFAPTTYDFECQTFVKKGDTAFPLSDTDGVVEGYKTVRLTPEDTTNEGFIMDVTKVQVSTTWSSAEGKLIKCSFKGIKPASGNTVKPYTAPID